MIREQTECGVSHVLGPVGEKHKYPGTRWRRRLVDEFQSSRSMIPRSVLEGYRCGRGHVITVRYHENMTDFYGVQYLIMVATVFLYVWECMKYSRDAKKMHMHPNILTVP